MTSKEKALEKEELTKLLEECKDSIIWNGDIDSLFPEEKAVSETRQSEPSIFRGRPKIKKEKQYPDAPAISNVTNWATYFNTPRTEEEIRDKCLSDYNGVCFTYLCQLPRPVKGSGLDGSPFPIQFPGFAARPSGPGV